jgi:hypothetical protein
MCIWQVVLLSSPSAGPGPLIVNLEMEGFLRFETRVVMSEVRLAAKFRHLGEAAERISGRAPSLCVIPWHSLYSMRKKS